MVPQAMSLSISSIRTGVSIIAVGGDKLSRGLTLEGLSVSYFLRASKMYDTLMQMGRWFGYRAGFLDLCRLYMSPELRRWFETITLATEELMVLFDEMADAGGTPSDFGLRIRSSPDGLTVTSPAKMQHGRKVKISFAGTISETINFHTDSVRLGNNLAAAEALVSALGAPDRMGVPLESVTWSGIEHDRVNVFLRRYVSHEAAQKAQSRALSDYIEGRVRDGELIRWTVYLASNSSGKSGKYDLAGQRIGLIRRAPIDDEVVGDRYDIRRLVSPPDELIDLSPGERDRALDETIAHWEIQREQGEPATARPSSPSGPQIRRVRDPRNGLLLVYPLMPPPGVTGVDAVIAFAISFPDSHFDSAVDFVVNQIWLQQEFQWEA